MAVLDDKTKSEIKEMLKELKNDVNIVFFEKDDCQFCQPIDEIYTDLSNLNEHVKYAKFHIVKDAEKAKEFGADEAPITFIKGKNKGKVVYYGIPSGYEFASLLEDIKMADSGDAKASESMKKLAEKLDSSGTKLRLQVFVTPTCPYCPRSVLFAHRLAFLSENVSGEMVEATEFMELSNKFQVSGVPKTVINDGKGEYVGAYPDDAAVEEIKKALNID